MLKLYRLQVFIVIIMLRYIIVWIFSVLGWFGRLVLVSVSGRKNSVLMKVCMVVRVNVEQCVERCFSNRVQLVVQSIVRSLKKLFSSGCGVCRLGLLVRFSQIELSIVRLKLIQVIWLICLCSSNQVFIVISNGSSVVIILVWVVLVYCRVKDLQRKYRQGLQMVRLSRYFQLFGWQLMCLCQCQVMRNIRLLRVM